MRDSVTPDAAERSAYSADVARTSGRRSGKLTELTTGQWQLRLMPWMLGVLILMTAAFLVLSLLETRGVRAQILAAPSLTLAPELAAVDCAAPSMIVSERQACARWKVLVRLEEYTLARRYHQANTALLIRTFIKYIGFLTGMVLAMVGAVFVLGRLTEALSEVNAEGGGLKFAMKSASPGLILAGLGTALMITTVLVNPPTDVSDAPVYLTLPDATPADAASAGDGSNRRAP